MGSNEMIEMIDGIETKVAIIKNQYLEKYNGLIENKILLIDNTDDLSKYDCVMEIKEDGVKISFTSFDQGYSYFKTMENEIPNCINQMYGVICKYGIIGLDIADVAAILNVKIGNFITIMTSIDNFKQEVDKLKKQIKKEIKVALFRVEGDITLADACNFVDSVFDGTPYDETYIIFSASYEPETYNGNARVSIWF